MNQKISELIRQSEVPISHLRAYHGHIDIENFANAIVDRCCELIEEASTSRCVSTTYDRGLADCVKLELVKFVKNYFQR